MLCVGELLERWWVADHPRLFHADAATTPHEYADALPLTDIDVADATDDHFDQACLDQRPLDQRRER